MKMMSWSRYHCLSGSLLRKPRRFSRRYRTAKSHKIWLDKTPQRGHVPQPRLPVSGDDGTRTGFFRFVTRLIRT